MAKRKRKKKRGGKGRAAGVDDDSKASEDGLADEPLSPRDSSQVWLGSRLSPALSQQLLLNNLL